MVSFSFQEAFVPLILSGEKRMTIRKKARCSPGDTMHLFTGLRTKSCQKIGEARCQAVAPIKIGAESITIGMGGVVTLMARTDELDFFARNDGFESWQPFRDFFKDRYGLPFSGFAHLWEKMQLNL